MCSVDLKKIIICFIGPYDTLDGVWCCRGVFGNGSIAVVHMEFCINEIWPNFDNIDRNKLFLYLLSRSGQISLIWFHVTKCSGAKGFSLFKVMGEGNCTQQCIPFAYAKVFPHSSPWPTCHQGVTLPLCQGSPSPYLKTMVMFIFFALRPVLCHW